MRSILEKIYEEQQMVCIYTNKRDTEKFFVGVIKKILYDKLLFQSINSDGKTDGFMVLNIEDIYLIETDNSYIKNIVYKCDTPIEFADLRECSGDLLVDFLCSIIERGNIVEIELLNSYSIDIRGKIMAVNDKYIEVESLNEENAYDGKSYCHIDDISMIWVSTK